MKRTIQHSLLAGLVAMTFAAGAAMAAAPERDPGQQSPTTTANSPAQQSNPAATPSNAPAGNAANSYETGTRAADGNGMAATTMAQEKFLALDANGDGVIDRQEASASKALSAEFKKLDTDNDGKLSPSEFGAAKNLASIKIDSVGMPKKNTKGYQQ